MNIQQMMRQAQQMQRKMQENQQKLENTEFEGTSGNGLIKVKAMGNYAIKSVYIDKSLMNADEKDMLEDLLVVAFNDIMKKITEASDSSMSDATGGINLKNLKLPF